MPLTLLLLAGARAAEDAYGECTDFGAFFQEITADSGIRSYGNTKGVTLNDIDGDGLLDLYVATAPSRAEGVLFFPGESLLYLNRGGMRFDEVGHAWGVDGLCEDRSPLWGDLDNDGLPDLYVTVNGENILYRNTGEGGFEDVTEFAGAAGHLGWGHEGILLDYDRDGWLDVFFTNGPEDGSGPNALLRNQGDGTFADVSEEAGVAGYPSGKGACVLDVDDDGWPDLFVATGREYPNALFVNQGDGTFVDEAVERGVDDPMHRFGVGVVCGDLDEDGDDDILVVTHDRVWGGNELFENRGGVFAEVAAAAGLADFIDGHGLDLVDVDLDGRLDVVMSGIRNGPHLFINEGGMRFARACVPQSGLVINEPVTWGVVSGDMDDDGFPEVYVSQGLGRRPRDDNLFHNLGVDGPGAGNAWIKVRAIGGAGNPSALGARVEVEAEGRRLVRTVGDWSAFNSQGPLEVTVGLGGARSVDRVRVTFPDGEVVEVPDPAPFTRVEVRQEAPVDDEDLDGVPDGWDACPLTPRFARTDGEGCTPEQRTGFGLAALEPADGEVADGPPRFTWSGEQASTVIQVGTDGTFGPAGRFDFGPVGGSAFQPSEEQWAEVLQAVTGSGPVTWRLVAVDRHGATATTAPRVLHLARETTLVRIPMGTNSFQPAWIAVDAGSTVTWWNDAVAAGNLQNEPHDVQLLDPEGLVLSDMHELVGAGSFTWTFDTPGNYGFICQRHSGMAAHGDALLEGSGAMHVDGPWRCMAGGVIVR